MAATWQLVLIIGQIDEPRIWIFTFTHLNGFIVGVLLSFGRIGFTEYI